MMSNDESIRRRVNTLRERIRRLEDVQECTLEQYVEDIIHLETFEATALAWIEGGKTQPGGDTA
jgi:hypothetical protein